MKLSTKGRYGLKAMVDLAVSYGNGCVSLSTLASNQDISEAYLERILAMLKKTGFIGAVRGSLGGYELLKEPGSINVGEILRVLEGSTTLIECVDKNNKPHKCTNACTCSARPLWMKLQMRIDEVLNSTTLKDLADDYEYQKRRLAEYE